MPQFECHALPAVGAMPAERPRRSYGTRRPYFAKVPYDRRENASVDLTATLLPYPDPPLEDGVVRLRRWKGAICPA